MCSLQGRNRRAKSLPLWGRRSWAAGGVGEQYVGASWPAALALDSAAVRKDNAIKQISLLARQNAPLPLQRLRGVVLSQRVDYGDMLDSFADTGCCFMLGLAGLCRSD